MGFGKKKTESETKVEDYVVKEGQVEEGIIFNPVTTDVSEQDTFNEDTVEDLNEEGTVIENTEEEEVTEGVGADGFVMRTSKPGAGNKFYIRKSSGGYSNCVQGKPTDANCNVLANCVGYAAGRFNEIIGEMKYNTLCCNAENFIERAIAAGLQIVSKPSLGGILVFQKGATLGSSDGAGHVLIVERVDSENQIYTSESGYGSTAFWNQIRKNDNGRWGMSSAYSYRGCIVNPEVGYQPYIEPTPVVTDPFPGVSDEELATRVWTGEFGSGEDRKNKLGSRYDAVQALVDQGYGKPEEPAPEPTPVIEDSIKVGDSVVIIGAYASSSNATSAPNTAAVNWTRTVLKIWDGRNYPYQVGNNKGTTGFFKAESLRKN